MKIQEFLTGNERIDLWLSTHLKSYLTKDSISAQEISHIIDYLQSDSSPKRIKKLSVPEAVNQSHKWTEKLNKKNTLIEDVNKDIHIIKNYNNGYFWALLKSENSYNREGNLMGHCVSSYFNKDVKIYSLRDKKNNPHCTLEVEKNTLKQLKGKQNKAVIEKYHEYVADFVNQFKTHIRNHDLELANLVVLNDIIYPVNQIPENLIVNHEIRINNVKKLPAKLICDKKIIISTKKETKLNLSEWKINQLNIQGGKITTPPTLKSLTAKNTTIEGLHRINSIRAIDSKILLESLEAEEIDLTNTQVDLNKIIVTKMATLFGDFIKIPAWNIECFLNLVDANTTLDENTKASTLLAPKDLKINKDNFKKIYQRGGHS